MKTNEQLIADHIAEGKTKLDAGDFDAAIAAAERALVIDQENPDALALKIKAEEAKRAAPAPTPTPADTRPNADTGTDASAADAGASTNADTDTRAKGRDDPVPPKSKPKPKPGPTAAPSPYVQQRYAQGKAALERGRYTEAAAAFEEVLQQEPGYLDTQALLTQTRSAQKTKAVEACRPVRSSPSRAISPVRASSTRARVRSTRTRRVSRRRWRRSRRR